MAQTPLVTHRLLNVEARFPKLNQPYFYDSSEGANGRTVPCSLDTPNAKWELGLRMDAKTTQDFMQAYAQAWQESPSASTVEATIRLGATAPNCRKPLKSIMVKTSAKLI